MSAPKLLYRLGTIETKAPEWMIKGLIEQRSLAGFFGPSGEGKTFIANDISASVAIESSFHGCETRTTGAVAIIAGEGYRGYPRRFRAYEIRYGVSLADAPIYVSARPVPFGDAGAVAPLYDELDEIATADGSIALVVVDTLSRNLSGDENSSLDMPGFVDAITALRNRYRCTVLVVHHTGHSNTHRSRGHSAFRAALDHEYRVEREDRTVRLTCTKAKESEPAEPMQFEIRTVELDITDEDGQTVTSAVLDRTDYEAPGAEKPKKAGRNKAKALDVLEALVHEHAERVRQSGRDIEEAQVLVTDWKAACEDRADMDRKRFSEAKNALVRDGSVTVEAGYARLASHPTPSSDSGFSVRPSVRPNPLRGVSDRTDNDTGPLSESDGIFGRFSDDFRTPRTETEADPEPGSEDELEIF